MKKSTKILSLILSVLTLLSVFSAATPVFAEDVNEYIADKEYTEKLLTEVVENNTEEKAPIVKEIEEKRDENKKVYLREDGTYTAVISKTPVHYEKDGEWVDIVNDLKTDGDVLTNTAGNFNVEFPKEISEGNEIKIENGKESLTFSIVETEKSNGKVKNNKKQKQDKNKVSDEEIFNNDISRTVSEIQYEDVLKNTNLEYVVTPTGVKENIIVENKESLKKSYSFNITKGKLQAELDKENNLYFKNSKGEVVFTIPAPVMTDSNGAISYDIDVKVKNLKKETITLTYTPDKKWLNAKDRVYPVAIDPVIVVESGKNDSYIEDTVIGVNTADAELATKNGCNDFLAAISYTREADDNNIYQTLKYDVLVKLNMDIFSAFKEPDIVVTNINYVISGSATSGNILAKEISGSWDSTTITGADVYPQLAGTDNSATISYGSGILDYCSGVGTQTEYSQEILSFNITNLFQDWLYGRKTNNGFALTTEDNGCASLCILGGKYTNSKGKTTYYNSCCTVDYIEAGGYNSEFEYISQDIGRAGTFNVNTFARSLSSYREDLSMSGNRMPVNLAFNYNSALSGFAEWQTKICSAYDEENYTFYSPYGDNWTPNYLKCITTIDDTQYFYFTETGSIVVFNVSEDEDGNVIFEPDQNSESGYELSLIEDSENTNDDYFELVITTATGEKEYFDEDGWLKEIREAEPNQDGTYDKISIEYYDDYTDVEVDFQLPKIKCITDGANRTYNFNYTNDKLTSVICRSSSGTIINAGTTNTPLRTTYKYYENTNRIKYVSYISENSNEVTYTYDTSGNLTNAKNVDGYNITYNYDTLGKVTKITEKADATQGNSITLSSVGNRETKVVDSYYGTKYYQFGNDGKLAYAFDEKGDFYKSENTESNDENVSVSCGWDTTPINILRNGGFERTALSKPTGWTDTFKVQTTDNNNACIVTGTDSQTQSAAVSGSKVYTFSIDAKDISEDSDSNNGFKIQIKAGYPTLKTKTETLWISPTEDYERYSVTVVAPAEITLVRVYIGGTDTVGKFLIDNAQLEAGYGTSKYNYIENGNFMYESIYWSGGKYEKYPNKSATSKGSLNLTTSDNINGVTKDVLKFYSALPVYDVVDSDTVNLGDTYSSATQTVEVNGKKDDIFSIGGWFKGEFTDGLLSETVKNNYEIEFEPVTTRAAQVKASYTYTDENGVTQNEDFAVNFLPGVEDWQYANDSFALKGDVENIDVTVITKNIPTTTYFTNISLVKDEDSFFIGDSETETEDTTPTATCVCQCADCYSGENCPCTGAVNNECQCPECLRKETSTKDSFGNILSSKSTNGVQYIETLATYTSDGNQLKSVTDENGNVTTYNYDDALSGVLKSITSPVGTGSDTTTTNYSYSASGNLTTLSTDTQNLSYTYNKERLVGIVTSNGEYEIEYDIWGQVKCVYLVTETKTPLVSYTYNSGANRTQIKTITYNQDVYSYVYNEDGEVVNIKLNGNDKHIITYDNLGNLSTIKNTDGRMVLYSNNGTSIYTPSTQNESGYSLIYQSLVTDDGEYIEENYGVTYKDTESEYDYDSNTGSSTSTTGVEINDTYRITQTNKTDWFGRATSDSVSLYNITNEVVDDEGNVVTPATTLSRIETEYNYPVASDGKTTTRLEKFINKTYNGNSTSPTVFDGISYEYDKQNRIIAEKTLTTSGGKTDKYSYQYDKLGQLVRFNDAVANKSYTYSYDSNGNMLSKKEYNYTTGQLGTALDTINYTYENSWKDQLSEYDGEQIKYDAIGNPTKYLGATLEWEGRNLKSYEKGSKKLQFEYDENGMRYRTTVTNSGSVSYYDYVWDSNKLVSMVYTSGNTSQTAKYLYGSSDEVIGMVITDSNNSISTYYYLRNAQGDITGIVNSSGKKIISYTYDVFGNCTETYHSTTTAENTNYLKVNVLNPFGYRGYCYDADMGLYYLQSRYYDPNTGRFINADDTYYLNATGTVLGCNLFAYCENDPINKIDPKGTIALSTCVIIGAVAGAIIGGTIGGVISYKKYQSVKWKYVLVGIAAGGVLGAALGYCIGIAIGASATTAATAKSFSATFKITPKISKQMARRGWSKSLIKETIRRNIGRKAINRATGNAATAYFTKSGAYVVIDNVTKQIVQISNINDPKWVVDATIKLLKSDVFIK